jgi:hypothetical protein
VYHAGAGLESDFTTPVFFHEAGESHYLLMGLEIRTTSVTTVQGESSDLFPNPASNILYYNPVRKEVEHLILYDASGTIVRQTDVSDSSGCQAMDISGLVPGMYFFKGYGMNCILDYPGIIKQ